MASTGGPPRPGAPAMNASSSGRRVAHVTRQSGQDPPWGVILSSGVVPRSPFVPVGGGTFLITERRLQWLTTQSSVTNGRSAAFSRAASQALAFSSSDRVRTAPDNRNTRQKITGRSRPDMSDEYRPQDIEKKWQRRWEETGLYRSVVDPDRKKYYALTMLPYPSGNLHIGHWYAMAPSDARARYMRMKGYNVLFPMGFDAFGLPAENAAIQRKIHPKKWTYANIENMRKQLKSMGAMFDWEREAISSDPEYYKWTQWFFIKFFEKGLAYKKESPVDFCPNCNTTLAREQVVGEQRVCERCGTPVIKKRLNQWFFKITDYADELLDFSDIDWPERVVTMQKNWIGRSEGAEVIFKTERGDELPVFTTRPDTLWGATFMVMAPEHPLVAELTTEEQRAAVDAYVEQAA